MTEAETLLVSMLRDASPSQRKKLLCDIISSAAPALSIIVGASEAAEFVYRVADHILDKGKL